MTHDFATCPAYLVPVEIRETPQYGKGHRGVFAAEPIAKGTKLWVWTDRVTSIHRDDLEGYIANNFGSNLEATRIFLRQGFVLPRSSSSSETLSLPREHQPPQSTQDSGNSNTTNTTNKNNNNTTNNNNNNNNSSNGDDDFFHSNPTDSGRLTNHSSDANTGPDGALRDILPGEELTIDYSFHGNPEWYRRICAKYGVATEAEIAALCLPIAEDAHRDG